MQVWYSPEKLTWNLKMMLRAAVARGMDKRSKIYRGPRSSTGVAPAFSALKTALKMLQESEAFWLACRRLEKAHQLFLTSSAPTEVFVTEIANRLSRLRRAQGRS